MVETTWFRSTISWCVHCSFYRLSCSSAFLRIALLLSCFNSLVPSVLWLLTKLPEPAVWVQGGCAEALRLSAFITYSAGSLAPLSPFKSPCSCFFFLVPSVLWSLSEPLLPVVWVQGSDMSYRSTFSFTVLPYPPFFFILPSFVPSLCCCVLPLLLLLHFWICRSYSGPCCRLCE
jgi:hypothetical protein